MSLAQATGTDEVESSEVNAGNEMAEEKAELDEVEWSQETYTCQEYSDIFEKPSLIKIVPSKGDGTVNFGPSIDTSKPFLLFSQRRRTKVIAEYGKMKKGVFVGDGPALEIPKDYMGWFQFLKKDGTESSFMTTIREVEQSRTRYFLTLTTIDGFAIPNDKNSGAANDAKEDAVYAEIAEDLKDLQLGDEYSILPGETLKVVETITRAVKNTNQNENGEADGVSTCFMICITMRRKRVALPIVHPGQFYAIANKSELDIKDKVVHQMWSVLESKTLPINVSFAFGWIPSCPPNKPFTGVLRLLDCIKPDSFIMYNFTKKGLMLLELPFDADVRLRTATNQSDLEWSDAFKEALQVCQKNVFSFAIAMKSLTLKYSSTSKEKTPARGLMSHACDVSTYNTMEIYPKMKVQQPFVFHDSFAFAKEHGDVLGDLPAPSPSKGISKDKRQSIDTGNMFKKKFSKKLSKKGSKC